MTSHGDSDGDSDGDFEGYVAARWPRLVRSLVLLGCPERLAGDTALEALARCGRDWSRIAADGDADAVVTGEVVAAWDRRRSRHAAWWDSDVGSAGPASGSGIGDVLDGLDALSPQQRAAVVLDRYLGVATEPVGETPVAPSSEQLRAAAEAVPVLASPSAEQIVARGRADTRRRRRTGVRRALVVAVPVLLVAAGLTWWADRRPAPSPDALVPLPVTRADNPTNVVWQAGGVLHLRHVTMPAPTLRQMSALGTGVVYADAEGRVVALADDGSRVVLGHEDTRIGFVASDARGWAAWVDVTGGTRDLVVVDVAARRVVGRAAVGTDVRPIAIDASTVYLADDTGVRGWLPLSRRRPDPVVEPADLVAARAATRVYQSGATQLQMFPYFGLDVPVTGIGGRLSDDGRLLLTRTRGAAGGDGPVAVYTTATGEALQTGVAGDELALDAAFGPSNTVTYLIARKADRPLASDQLRASFAGALQLRTCQLFLARDVPPLCDLVAEIPVSGISPLLAH